MLPKQRLEFSFGDLMFIGPVYPSIRILADLRTSHIHRGVELPHIDRLLTALSLKHETCGQTVDHRGASNRRVSRKLEPITCAVSSVIGAQKSHLPPSAHHFVLRRALLGLSTGAKALLCRNPDEVTMGISGYFRQEEVDGERVIRSRQTSRSDPFPRTRDGGLRGTGH